jgi:hypothetical protein
LAIDQTAAGFRRSSTPLLVEERHPLSYATVPQVADPVRIAWPVPWPALTARDKPVNSIQTQAIQRAKKRLRADESDGRRHLAQVIRAEDILVRLDGYTRPDVGSPGERLTQPREAGRTFREDLEYVPVGRDHYVEHLLDVIVRYRLVEKVRH